MPCCCCGKSTPPYVNWCASCYAEWDHFQLLEYCPCGKPVHNPNKFFLDREHPNKGLSAICDDCFQRLEAVFGSIELEELPSLLPQEPFNIDDFD
jgi:hypothetical protein